nr:MAG TPA: nucelotide kinase [Caudoviricetes sp.]
MKLLELLVKERIEWHPEALCYTQDECRSACAYKITDPILEPDLRRVWTHEGMVTGHHFRLKELADDWQTAIVTKEQYDNACKLVDDGYTLWFGGECPVNMNAHVQVILANGKLCEGKAGYISDWAKALVEGKESEHNIIAYKLTGEKPASIETIRKPFDFDTSAADVVNHPSHYTNGKVECIDAIESATVGKTGIEAVCVANVIKYLWRYEDKNGLEDIKKAQWYLNKLIESSTQGKGD